LGFSDLPSFRIRFILLVVISGPDGTMLSGPARCKETGTMKLEGKCVEGFEI
jgi:hypothetical protein